MIRCPLCGEMYVPNSAGACQGCLMSGACAANCCPRCGYRLPAETKLGGLLSRIWKRGESHAGHGIATKR